jgi:hypothetical protein
MADKRYLGNIITDTPTEPSDNYGSTPAAGVWSLNEALFYAKAGLWPTAGNVNPIALSTTARNVSGSITRQLDQISITTVGNATDFGDSTFGSQFNCAGFSSSVKAFEAGGGGTNTISTVAYSSGSAYTDFGDLTVARNELGGYSNSTRGIVGGGGVIDYVTMASEGNATDFGDFSTGDRYGQARAAGSQTRAIFGGFESDKRSTDYITPSTTGNAVDYGSLSNDHNNAYVGANLTRIIIAGQYTGGSDHIEYNTISSTGSFSTFGQLSAAKGWGGTACNSTRMVMMGGFSAANEQDFISYVTIGTTGNDTDFGDLTTAKTAFGGRAPSTPSVSGA